MTWLPCLSQVGGSGTSAADSITNEQRVKRVARLCCPQFKSNATDWWHELERRGGSEVVRVGDAPLLPRPLHHVMAGRGQRGTRPKRQQGAAVGTFTCSHSPALRMVPGARTHTWTCSCTHTHTHLVVRIPNTRSHPRAPVVRVLDIWRPPRPTPRRGSARWVGHRRWPPWAADAVIPFCWARGAGIGHTWLLLLQPPYRHTLTGVWN